MADYSLKINGTEYTEVQGTEDWSKTIVRDFNDRVFRTKGDFNLTAWGSLFDLIYGNVSNNGACTSLNSRIYFRENKIQDYTEWWRGEMKMQDGQWDLIKQKVDIQILDDVWASKFANSDDQKVFINTIRSKSRGIIPTTPFSLCDFYDPDGGAFTYTDRRCYRVFDVFTFLVDYHTDGNATFSSSFFDTGGDGEQYYITIGKEIRTGANTANPEISFSELFDEMNKKFNLWIIVDSDDFDNPIVKVEKQDYVFENTKAVEVEDPENIVMQIDLDQLYTLVNVGSNATDFEDIDGADYPTVRFESWNDESYNTDGCEFENNTLDLVSSWKIDHNSINHQLEAPTEQDADFENDIFIVEIDPSTLNAYQFTTDFTGSAFNTDYIYNFNLTNEQVINNWFDGIPSQITKELSIDYYFYADSPNNGTLPASSFNTETITFDNDSVAPGSDSEDIYTTPTEDITKGGQFKAPIDQFYTFDTSVTFTSSDGGQWRLFVYHYTDDNLGTLIQAHKLDDIVDFSSGSKLITLSGSKQIFMEANEVALVTLIYQTVIGTISIEVDSGYYTMNPLDGIDYAAATDEPLIYDYDVSRFKLALSDYNTLDNNLGYIRFIDTKNNQKYDVWATEMKYNPVTQIVESGKFIGKPVVLNCEWVLTGGIWTDVNCWDDGQLWID